MLRFAKLFLLLSLSFSLGLFTPSTALAQATAAGADAPTGKTSTGGPRRQIATIIFAGLGGAILGLSTLSFYGRPQDKLSNIAVGFAIGVIAGTAYVTYKAASSPGETFGAQLRNPETDRPPISGDAAALQLHEEEMERLARNRQIKTADDLPILRWAWTF